MQNTARNPTVPINLIKNFFIAGVDEVTLAERIRSGNSYRIQPDVLFSMYKEVDFARNYLQFVFPEKLAVEYQATEPRFYSFVSTDEKGFNSFFHVLHFYEEVTEAEVNSSDFDIATRIHANKKRQQERQRKREKEAAQKLESSKVKVEVKQTLESKITNQTIQSANPKFPNVREGSTGEIAQGKLLGGAKSHVTKFAEEGALFSHVQSKRRVLNDKRRGSKQCLNICDLAAMKELHQKDDDEEEISGARQSSDVVDPYNITQMTDPKTPAGKNGADNRLLQAATAQKQAIQDKEMLKKMQREENQRRIEAEKKRKMENVMHKIQQFSQAGAFNVSGIRSGDQSLNNTINMNLQISTLDPSSKIQQIKQRGIIQPVGMNSSAYLAIAQKQGKASSYIVSPRAMMAQQQHRQSIARDTFRSRKYTEQDVYSDYKSADKEATTNEQLIGTPNIGVDLSQMPLDSSVNFGNMVQLHMKSNKPSDVSNMQMLIDENYTTPFTTEGYDSSAKKMRVNQRHGQTQIGMNGADFKIPNLMPSLSKQELDYNNLYFQSNKQLQFSGGVEGDFTSNFDPNELNMHQQLLLEKQISNFPESNKDIEGGNYDEEQDQLQELMKKKFYVPVAIVLETETEFHDTFRLILLSLFEMIRVPESVVSNRMSDNKTIAFAELIAHVAFMRTIPAPPFNSVYNIYMFGQQFQIKEGALDQIPNKSQLAIKILFEVLDVKSIFYCWKALLFDKSLVIVSSQYSLQFYVAEALRQLLFPLTWQNSYIQPGNEDLAGHCDGMMICIYGSNSMVNSYDFFAALEHPEIVIVDIDAGFTNNIHLPCVPDENMYIRILNTLKNARINQYDKAFPDMENIAGYSNNLQVDAGSSQNGAAQGEDFVTQVRETFFSLLKPFLSKAEECINKNVEPTKVYFSSYFNQQEYLSHFENYGKAYHEFAKALLESTQFQHFCDDSFDEELNNFHMMHYIYESRGEAPSTQSQIQNHSSTINQNYFADGKKTMGQGENFSRKKSTFFDGVSMAEELGSCKKGRCNWPESEPVVFNFRMPQDKQRVMLFEKILFMVEDSMAKRERDLSRRTNEDLVKNKNDLRYEEYVKLIKQIYPNKLREGRIQQEQQRRIHKLMIIQQQQMANLQNQTVSQMGNSIYGYHNVSSLNNQAQIMRNLDVSNLHQGTPLANQTQPLQSSRSQQRRLVKGLQELSSSRQPHQGAGGVNITQGHQVSGSNTQRQVQRRKGIQKVGSSDSLNVVEIDVNRSSIIGDKVNLRFNQSNIYNQNTSHLQGTPGSNSQFPSRQTRFITQKPITNAQNQGDLNIPSYSRPIIMNQSQNPQGFPQQAYITPRQGQIMGAHQLYSNQSIQIPHEGIHANSQDEFIQSFVHLSNSNHSLVIDQQAMLLLEQQRILSQKQRVSRLMYGKYGLMSFVQHLLGLLTEKQKKRVNYYFSLNQQIDSIMQTEKKLNAVRKDQRMNKQIDEVYEEDKSPSKRSSRATNLPLCSQTQDHQTPGSTTTKQEDNENTGFKRQYTNQTAQSAFNATSSQNTACSANKFKSEKDWFSVESWDQNCTTLKRTYQFVLMRQKLYESFECPEDGYSHIWRLLVKYYPTNQMRFFPGTKFLQIWDSLTASQQLDSFTKLGQKNDKPQVRMVCKYFMKQRQTLRTTNSDSFINSSPFALAAGVGCSSPLLPQSLTHSPSSVGLNATRNLKSDESLFYNASLSKTYSQKKQEKKERESQLQAQGCVIPKIAREITKQPDCSAASIAKEEAKQKKLKKQIDINMKSIGDTLKKKALQLKSKKEGSTNIDISRNETISQPLSARAQTQQLFNFKTTDRSQIESSSTLDDRMTTNTNNLDQSKTFNAGSRRESLPFQNDQNVKVSSGKQSACSNVNYDMRDRQAKKTQKIFSLSHPVKVSIRMMERIIKFWRTNSKHIHKDQGFKESEQPRIQKELSYLQEKYLSQLQISDPNFEENNLEKEKQAFFLNIFNFLVLYNLAVQFLSNPESIHQLVNFNMWQSFLISSKIVISYHSLNAYTIFNCILRAQFPLPHISDFMLQSPMIDPESQFSIHPQSTASSTNATPTLRNLPSGQSEASLTGTSNTVSKGCSKYRVLEPSKFISFGFYLPLKKMPQLKVFTSEDLEEDLRSIAQYYLEGRIKVREHSYYIALPKFMDWFSLDFQKQGLMYLLEQLDQALMQKDQTRGQVVRVLQSLRDNRINASDFIIEYGAFSWEFKPKNMQDFFIDGNAGFFPSQ